LKNTTPLRKAVARLTNLRSTRDCLFKALDIRRQT
jgi:hypothetical protein